MRTAIAQYICEAGATSTTRVIAYAVMPNHVHMIVRQGAQPIGWMVQRVLQRAALLVRRTFSHKGHVFGCRYWSGLCDDAKYLRQVIIYTHLNPFYAGLCTDPDEYRWTSHRAYVYHTWTPSASIGVDADHGLRLFASSASDVGEQHASYMRFIRYWMGRPKLPLGARYLFTAEEVAYAPLAEEGDAFWASEYGDAVSAVPNLVPTNVDIRDRALVALNALAPDLTLEQMRAGGRVEAIGRVRRELVAMLLAGGHRNGAIARCLNLSPSHVSAVAAEVRSREFGALMRQDHAGMGRS
jgi:REP element-mobilizing transposase RayT